MAISLRSFATVGVATITATAIAFGPAVQPPAPPAPTQVVHIASPPVQLAADIQPLAAADLPNLLIGWLERIIVPPSASQPFPTPPTAPGPVPSSIPGTLEWAYHAVEPWVRYGFELATYAAGWVPYVGWLSGQIMIFYNFGERITHAIVHNTLDWLNGQGSFLFNLGEGIAWSINALIQLGIDEWNYFLPPLPPLPPFPFAAQAAQAAQATTTSATADMTTSAAVDPMQLNEKHSAVKGADVADVPDEEAAAADATTVEKTKEPKASKEPEPATEATAQAEVSSDSDVESTETKKDSTTEKKTDKGPKAGTESSTSPKNNDNKKNDDNGKKKADKE